MKNDDIRAGFSDALPILLAVVPFAAVFGTLAIDRGLTFGETMLASATIFAGASQYAMIDLMGQNVPPWSIVLAVFAINFRHVLYSASLGRHLGAFSPRQRASGLFFMVDPVFASSERRAALSGLRPTYYFTYALLLYGTWMASNVAGALFGNLIEDPALFGLDFILPLYFAGLIAGFHSRPGFLPILIISSLCSLLAYFTVGTPWNITLGGAAGLVTAALLSKPENVHREKAGGS